MKKRIINALNSEKNDRVPIWFMRQAGRYLPEYQELRKKYSFWDMVTQSEIAAEVTLQPIKRYDLDAAIIFSDILVILHGLGFKVSFEKGPPVLDRRLKTFEDIEELEQKFSPDLIEHGLPFYWQALKQVKEQLAADKTLIGFAAAPFTLASYLIEGETSKFHARIRGLMYSDPSQFQRLLYVVSQATISYLNCQIQSGAEVIQIFDSWADVVAPEDYDKFIMPFNETIVEAVSKWAKVIFFCKGASVHHASLLRLYDKGLSALSVDWRMSIDALGDKSVQGNLDPAVLFSSPAAIKKAVNILLDKRANQPGYIFNLGHGVYPGTPVDNVKAMVDAVQNYEIKE